MAKQQATQLYSKEQQATIMQEADTSVQKLLQGIMHKHPGVIIASQLGFTFPSAPIMVQHSGNTRPLTAKEVAPPPQATE